MLELRPSHEETIHTPDATLTLPFSARQRSRLRVELSTGELAALHLPRGSVLRGGQRLRATDGRIIEVVAAHESVSTVRSADPSALVRIAYHLGNRHVALEVGDGYVRYLHDHVLDAMVGGLGVEVRAEEAPFEPESGAYGGHTHPHGGHSEASAAHSHGGHSGRGHSHGGHSHGGHSDDARAHGRRSDEAHVNGEDSHDGDSPAASHTAQADVHSPDGGRGPRIHRARR